MIHKYQKLEDIPILDSYYGRLNEGVIDSKIRNLVRALQGINLKTIASCEGHLDNGLHQHPWIGFDYYRSSDEGIATLRYLLETYNGTSKVKWIIIDGDWVLPSTYRELCGTCPRNSGGVMDIGRLSELQQDSGKLAQYIFENSIDEISEN